MIFCSSAGFKRTKQSAPAGSFGKNKKLKATIEKSNEDTPDVEIVESQSNAAVKRISNDNTFVKSYVNSSACMSEESQLSKSNFDHSVIKVMQEQLKVFQKQNDDLRNELKNTVQMLMSNDTHKKNQEISNNAADAASNTMHEFRTLSNLLPTCGSRVICNIFNVIIILVYNIRIFYIR